MHVLDRTILFLSLAISNHQNLDEQTLSQKLPK